MNRNIDELIASSLMKANIQRIRPNQKTVIERYLDGKDVLFCSPTGSGKSLTFELSPYLYKAVENTSHATVIVVSPLIALMKKQTEKCVSLGLKAVYMNDVAQEATPTNDDSLVSTIEKLTVDDIRDGEADIIFTSPESILGHHRNIVTELDKEKHLKAVFIDEAHCISKLRFDCAKCKDMKLTLALAVILLLCATPIGGATVPEEETRLALLSDVPKRFVRTVLMRRRHHLDTQHPVNLENRRRRSVVAFCQTEECFKLMGRYDEWLRLHGSGSSNSGRWGK
ncbi:ATP-dependent DNA helicase RecQ-like [Haliotis cracherodii]|uniref:ATP-dependent DNA helicase RecQ-like n=1 Tax=Haliotis cracherodii TaxID=6455 RepID=UPI0039E93204